MDVIGHDVLEELISKKIKGQGQGLIQDARLGLDKNIWQVV